MLQGKSTLFLYVRWVLQLHRFHEFTSWMNGLQFSVGLDRTEMITEILSQQSLEPLYFITCRKSDFLNPENVKKMCIFTEFLMCLLPRQMIWVVWPIENTREPQQKQVLTLWIYSPVMLGLTNFPYSPFSFTNVGNQALMRKFQL